MASWLKDASVISVKASMPITKTTPIIPIRVPITRLASNGSEGMNIAAIKTAANAVLEFKIAARPPLIVC